MPTDPLSPEDRENGSTFSPKFDAAGLLTAVVVDDRTDAVLVVAHMNSEAIAKTLETGDVHFWSRSRDRLWMKGESSGHILRLVEARVDCDQDVLLIRARPAGPTCHTGAASCFYRRIAMTGDEPSLVKVNT